MSIAERADVIAAGAEFQIRKIDINDLRMALGQGWQDFRAKRGDLIIVGIVYPVICFIASFYFFERSLLPLIFPLLAGMTLLGPALASGYYELARRRELGLDSRWMHFFDVLKGSSAISIATLTGVLAVIFALWVASAAAIYAATLGPEVPESIGSFMRAVFSTREGTILIVAGNLVGLLFAIVTLAIAAVSFPMLVDRPVGWQHAVKTSLRAAYHNPVTMAVWGLIVAGLLLIGTITAFVGLAVILPLLGYATWHLYTRVVVR